MHVTWIVLLPILVVLLFLILAYNGARLTKAFRSGCIQLRTDSNDDPIFAWRASEPFSYWTRVLHVSAGMLLLGGIAVALMRLWLALLEGVSHR